MVVWPNANGRASERPKFARNFARDRSMSGQYCGVTIRLNAFWGSFSEAPSARKSFLGFWLSFHKTRGASKHASFSHEPSRMEKDGLQDDPHWSCLFNFLTVSQLIECYLDKFGRTVPGSTLHLPRKAEFKKIRSKRTSHPGTTEPSHRGFGPDSGDNTKIKDI